MIELNEKNVKPMQEEFRVKLDVGWFRPGDALTAESTNNLKFVVVKGPYPIRPWWVKLLNVLTLGLLLRWMPKFGIEGYKYDLKHGGEGSL